MDPLLLILLGTGAVYWFTSRKGAVAPVVLPASTQPAVVTPSVVAPTVTTRTTSTPIPGWGGQNQNTNLGYKPSPEFNSGRSQPQATSSSSDDSEDDTSWDGNALVSGRRRAVRFGK